MTRRGPPASIPASDAEKIRRLLWEHRYTLTLIATIYGCAQPVVSRFCKRHDIPVPVRKRRGNFYRPKPLPPKRESVVVTGPDGVTYTKLPPGWAEGVEPGQWAMGFEME